MSGADLDGQPATMTVHVTQQGIGDVSAPGAVDAAVDRERAAIEAWNAAATKQRQVLYAVVRSALRRLLDDPGWIPGAVELRGSRVDVHLVIELDDLQVVGARASAELEQELLAARAGLTALIEDMEAVRQSAPAPE